MNTNFRSLLRRSALTILAASTLTMSTRFAPVAAQTSGHNATPDVSHRHGAPSIFQFSTLPALSLGIYDGDFTFVELLGKGDFGLGTVNALDGEVIILDGKAWQIRANGQVAVLGPKVRTPFAVVTRFDADIIRAVRQPTEYSALKSTLDKMLPTPNAPYAISIRGTFSRLKTRSVPAQNKPYRPLAEVVKTQTEWEWQNVKGTLVGFRFPSYLSNVNLADYHFHFLSDDKTRGGHLLDCKLTVGEIKVQTLRNFEMLLPQNGDFDNADLSTDQSAALQKAETGR